MPTSAAHRRRARARPPRRIRVLYLASGLHLGGSELQMLALARRLPRDRFEPQFVLLTDRGSHADAAEAEGIRLHVLNVRRPGANRIRFAVDVVRAIIRYVRIVRRERIEIVDAWLYHAYVLGAMTRPLTRVPVFLAGRRSLADFKETFGLIHRALDAIAKVAPDRIVANSWVVQEDSIRREKVPSSKLAVIRNGVEIHPPISAVQRSAVRAAWGVGDDSIVVGSVSNYKPGKGLEVLVEAVADLQARYPTLTLVLIGDGPLRGTLAKIAALHGIGDRVVLSGQAVDPRHLHAGIDVFAHPSATEGLPNAVLEAAASALAVVATDAGGTREIVIDGRTGLLVPVEDRAALADAIGTLIDDPALRLRLGTAARAYAAEAFGMDRFVAETAALYEQMLVDKGVRGVR